RTKERGYTTITNGIDGVIENPDIADIFFDATSAKAHELHAKVLKELNKIVVDLTPAAVGPFFSPAVESIGENTDLENVNMLTCGGQATIPIVHAINDVADVTYGEIVATISSISAGPGTRANIDECTITTRGGTEEAGGADKGQSLISLNPDDPHLMIRHTIYCEVKPVDEATITKSDLARVEVVEQ